MGKRKKKGKNRKNKGGKKGKRKEKKKEKERKKKKGWKCFPPPLQREWVNTSQALGIYGSGNTRRGWEGQILSRGIWECSVEEQLLFKSRAGGGGSMKIPTPSRVFPTSKACPGIQEWSFSHLLLIYGSGLIPEFLEGGAGMIYSREAAAGWRWELLSRYRWEVSKAIIFPRIMALLKTFQAFYVGIPACSWLTAP